MNQKEGHDTKTPVLNRYYAQAVDPEGHVLVYDDTRLYFYGEEDLQELIELCKQEHRDYQYMTHEIEGPTGRILYRWKRRTHPQEEELGEKVMSGNDPDDDFANFIEWLRMHAENGTEPGVFDPEEHRKEKARERRESLEEPDVPF